MKEPESDRIITIDLKYTNDAYSICNEFSDDLTHFNLKQQNNNTFYNCISDLVNLSKALILYNFNEFRKINFHEAESLLHSIYAVNSENNRENIIIDDYYFLFDLLHLNRAGILFNKTPSKYGYRGDVYLWKELEEYFNQKEIATNESVFIEQINEAIIKLTDNSIVGNKAFHVSKYSHGGMSGGAVSSKYWNSNLIPMLVGRYRQLKKIN